MRLNIRFISLVVVYFLLSGCAWTQSPEDYRYVDDGDVKVLNAKTAIKHDPNIANFPIFGALSKNVYLTEHETVDTPTLEQFCTQEYGNYTAAGWVRLDDLDILRDRTKSHEQIKLGVQVYVQTLDDMANALLVFRGTDFEEQEDWYANFRWFVRFFSFELDQYDEVRHLVPEIVEELEALYPNLNKVMATGHSLGGGLAQLAGYSTYQIDEVYAFDSSPVTGFYDIDGGERRFNSQNLKIYRIYEHGEVLAYLRLLMKGLYPVSEEHPDIIQVRFDLIEDGGVVGQHDIKTLTCNLYNDLRVGGHDIR